MRYIFVLLAIIGITVSGFALREHYRTDSSPCSINEKWDCGIVNHSPFAVLGGVPVAIIGMAGYLLLGILALKRSYRLLFAASLPALGFSLYLAHVEKDILGVWCIYCVASLIVITTITVLALGTAIIRRAPAKAG